MTLALDNIAKTFPDGTRALRPTDLDFAKGEIVSLLGPSGCGKTTLLRIIAGLEQPDAGGVVRFSGTDVTRLPIERRRVGMVFQSYALFPNMNVRRNIGYGLKMLAMPKAQIDARVNDVISMCRLDGLGDRAVTTLSGGQKQRVALARAVAPRPHILLLDEPLSALDAGLRETLRDELAHLLREFGITAVFVTHDQTEALAIADRVAVMSQGVIEQVAPPEQIYRHPASAFVAEFVGHAQRLDGHDSDGSLHLAGGSLPCPKAAPGGQWFVRAEDVHVATNGPLCGRVESTVFLGTHYRVAVSGAASGLLFAHAMDVAPRVGDRVTLRVDPDKLILLPDGARAE